MHGSVCMFYVLLHTSVCTAQVGPMTPETKERIRNMSQSDVPIKERRALYNGMFRRFKSGGLKPGLLQKYNACINEKKQRWKLLKEFIIDEDMFTT